MQFDNLKQMASPQRPGEITYYEELGVENTASPDQIHDAFRTLVRLLHPDQQTDPQLREMAEHQMRKLNRIHAVLSDSTRRTAYDESLANSRSAPIIVLSGSDGNLKKLITRLGTAAAIVFGTFLLIWFMLTSNNSEVRGQDARSPSAAKSNDTAGGDASDQIARLRDELRAVESERDSALEQLGRARKATGTAGGRVRAGRNADAPQAETASVSTATAMNELPALSEAAALPATAASAVKTGQFAGQWVYSKSSGSAAAPGGKSQYPPEFIEVTVIEMNGSLHGQYRSRYQVLDHAISPDVNFDFTGTPVGSSLNCTWTGPGGARGRMTLKLLPTSTVEVAWNATELGSQQWLVNGTATLVRK